MKINPKIIDLLAERNLQVEDAVPYLISLYLGYDIPSYVPLNVRRAILSCNIVTEKTGEGLVWHYPLFDDGVSGPFSWVVEEYIELFKIYKRPATHKREAIKRMKKLFAENPDIRKHEVLEATEHMLRTNDYPRLPHYFLRKGTGSDATQDILSYIDIIREQKRSDSSSNYTTMQ